MNAYLYTAHITSCLIEVMRRFVKEELCGVVPFK